MGLEEMEGKLVARRFRLKKMVGKGGYGAVFEAIQLSVERRCAVKILLPGRSDDEAVEQRFRVEARATSRLTHPNSVVLYDFGVDEDTGYLFLAQEFLDGMTLHEVLRQRRTLGVFQALSIMEQVAGSLQDAHQRGLVHRDVKPKNIMVIRRAGKGDFVKVIDFGIAKALAGDLVDNHDLTQTGMLVGTPQYMAPEQLLGHDIDGGADQYALAVLGYRMLIGFNPFRADSPMESALRHVNDLALPLRTYRPELEVTAEFEEVFLKALHKDRSERFDEIIEFVSALREAAGRSGDQSAGDHDLWRSFSEEVASKPTVVLDAVSKSGTGETKGSGDCQNTAPTAREVPRRALAKGETPRTRRVGRVDAAIKEESKEGASSGENDGDPEEQWVEKTPEIGRVRSGGFPRRRLIAGAVISLLSFMIVAALVVSNGKKDVDRFQESAVVDRGITGAPDNPTSLASADEGPHGEAAHEGEEVSETSTSQRLDETLESAWLEVARALEISNDRALKRAQKREEDRQRRRRPVERPARITVTLIPWGTLYVNGRAQTNKTRQLVELPAGTHELSLRQNGQVRARQLVDVRAGQSKMVVLEAQLFD